MTYDAADRTIVLFGGQDNAGFLNDTWTFSAGKWSRQVPTTVPPARNDAPIVYDPVLGSVLLIAGHGNVQALGDMWAFSHGNWSEVLPSVPFNYRWGYGAAFDVNDNEVLLYGGTNTTSLGVAYQDTWIYHVPPFSASAAVNATKGDAGEPFAFSANATSGSAPYNFSWVFGDGTHQFGANVTHAFPSGGNYLVKVFVNDSNNHSLLREINVTVAGKLAAHPSAAPDPALVGETVLFDANASGGTGPLNYTWDFGDGSSSHFASPTHSYQHPGNYTVQLVVGDSAGIRVMQSMVVQAVSGPFSAFASATPTVGNAPLTVSFNSSLEGGILPYSELWSFGDGTSSVQANPVHTYNSSGTFLTKLFASDGNGAQVVRYINVTVLGSQPLSVTATESSQTGTVPLEVAFTGLATGGTGAGYQYLWNFGDGSTGQGPKANHTYTAPGIFTPTVSVSDSQGNYAESTLQAITIAQPSAPPSLSVQASAVPETGVPPVSVPFTSSVSGGVAPYTYAWHFGDGGNSTLPDPVHTYDRFGAYNVTLWVNDSSSPVQTTLSTLTIEILRPGTGALRLMVAASPVSGYAPLRTTFSVAASGGSGSYPYVSWSFGDGTFASGNTASHIFLTRGIYHVNVAVTDSQGNTATTPFNVTVLTPPLHAYAAAMQYSDIAPVTITFNASAEGGTGAGYTYHWSFSDGGTATGSVVQHRFTTGGTFAVVVTVGDSAGNTAVATLNVTLVAPSHPPPTLLGLPVSYAYFLIGGVVAVLAALFGVLYLRRRTEAEKNRPKILPAWPEGPLTVLETSERMAVLRMAANAPIPKEDVLLLVKESPEVVEKEAGLKGMNVMQVAISDGENKIKPGDLDRIGHLLEAHLRTGEGKAVVVEALDMIIDANQVKGARRLLDVVREMAQENKGTVLVQLNPSSLPLAERTRLEEGATVLHY
jgi:PKD repeat protein